MECFWLASSSEMYIIAYKVFDMATKSINIPSLVKGLREDLDLTQEQFAREIGVTFATVNSWENNKRHPQPFLLRRLLDMKEERKKSSRKGKSPE